MRLIDADLLKEALGERPFNWTDSDAEIQECFDYDEFVALIDDAPTVDAVPVENINILNLAEVVRCKDCKWSESNHDNEDGYFCHHISHNQRWEVFSLCFCSYGERREP